MRYDDTRLTFFFVQIRVGVPLAKVIHGVRGAGLTDAQARGEQDITSTLLVLSRDVPGSLHYFHAELLGFLPCGLGEWSFHFRPIGFTLSVLVAGLWLVSLCLLATLALLLLARTFATPTASSVGTLLRYGIQLRAF